MRNVKNIDLILFYSSLAVADLLVAILVMPLGAVKEVSILSDLPRLMEWCLIDLHLHQSSLLNGSE